MNPAAIDKDILEGLGLKAADILATQGIGGGDVSSAFRWKTKQGDLFIKVNQPDLAPMFRAEKTALDVMHASGTIRVPVPLASGVSTECSWLALEWLDFHDCGLIGAQHLGRALAALHRCRSTQFGWGEGNYIGSSEQRNIWTDNWAEFFSEHRLRSQARLLDATGVSSSLVKALHCVADATPVLLAEHEPVASLLHGDLWGGNWASLADATAVIYDPAAYYGDRETDIAMTELFGGFPPGFYQAYFEVWPLSAGYEVRRDLYQLYHIANHALLFGGSYVAQGLAVSRRLLS